MSMHSLWDHGVPWLQWGAAIGASLAAAAFDLRARKIPNRLTCPAFLGGLIYALLAGGWSGLADGVLGSILLALPFILLFAFAGGGAGDAKMMGAIGAWLGVRDGTVVLLSVVLSGMILGIAWSVAKKRFGSTMVNLMEIGRSFAFLVSGSLRPPEARAMLPETKGMQPMPYGLAIFLGVCLAAGGMYLWRP